MKKHLFLSVFSVFFALFGGVGVAHAADYLPGCEKPTSSISDLDKTFATICKSGMKSFTKNGMDWTAYFNSNREVHGTAFCSNTKSGSAPSSSSGKYCWCGIESYTDGTTTFNSNPTAWTYVQSYTFSSSCPSNCPSACNTAIKNKPCDFVNGIGMCYTPTYQVHYSCEAGTTSFTDSNTYSSGATVTTYNGTQCTAPTGYVFGGWSCDNNIGKVSGGSTFTMPAGDVTCTAQYQAINYTVSFAKGNGTGTMSSQTNKHIGDTITLPANGFTAPSGYTFDGWSCDNGIGNKAANEQFTMPAANVTCTAQYQAIDYTVTFDHGPTNSSTTKHVGDSVTLPDSFGPTGYSFGGWSCDNNIGIKAIGETFTMPAANVTCTAVWNAINYTVSFDKGTGTGTMSSQTNKHIGDTITLPANGFTAPSGYTFDGWSCDNGIGDKAANEQFTMPAANVTCTAQWTLGKPKVYTITLKNYNNTSTHDTIYEQYSTGWFSNALASIPISSAPVPTRDGYTFRGYYTTTQSDATTSISSGTQRITKNGGLPANNTFSASTILYAAWARNCAPGAGCTCSLTVTDNGAVTYSNGAFPGYTLLDSDLIKYNPTCTAINYTVSFAKGTGTGTMSSQTNKHIGDTITLPSSTFTAPSGYTFSGWSCNNNIGNKAVGSTFTMPANNVTCTAIYENNTIATIDLTWDGGGTPSSCTYGSTFDVPTPTPMEGYIFTGWRVRVPVCSFTASEVNGMSYVDYGYKNDSTGAYGADEYNASRYGLTTDNSWATEFNTGIIKGMAKCSAKSGNNNNYTWSNASSNWSATESELTSASGEARYCWCQATNYTPNGGNQCNVSSSSWVFYNDRDDADNCAYFCAFDCANDVQANDGFRRAVFNTQEEPEPASQCSFTASEVDGMTDGDYGYAPLDGDDSRNEDGYGLTTPGEWAVEFNTGIIKGMAKCSAKSGNSNNDTWSAPSSNWSATESELTSASGEAKYCWCHATNYTPNDEGNQCNVSSSSWVFRDDPATADDCARDCAHNCAAYVQDDGGFRRAVFGVQ